MTTLLLNMGRTERGGLALLRSLAKGALIFAVLRLSTAVASGWEHSASLATSAEHDSNPSLLAMSEGGVWRGRLAPRYSLTGNFGRDEYAASLGMVAEQSSDERLSSRRRDKGGSLSWGHSFETASVRFIARSDEASTRATEFEDSGLVSRESTRTSYTFSLTAQNSLSENTSLTTAASQDGAKYEDGALRNYANRRLEITLGHAVSENLTTTARMSATEFEPDAPGISSTTHLVSFGVSAKPGAPFNWAAQYGFRHTVADTKSNGADGLVSLRWKGSTNDLSFTASRQYSPSSVGSMSVLDSVKGAWLTQWGSESRSSVDLSLSKRHGVSATEMAQVTAALIYDTSDASNVRVYVQEKRLDRAGSAATATIVGASLAYNWRP